MPIGSEPTPPRHNPAQLSLDQPVTGSEAALFATSRRARGVHAERVSLHEEHRALGEDADLVAHRPPAGGGVLQVDPVRCQHDEISPHLRGIAHNLRGAVAEDDLLPAGHPTLFQRVAEPREVVVGPPFEAGVEFSVFRRSHLTDHLDDVEECHLSVVLLHETCGDLQRGLVRVCQVDQHEDVLKHGPVLLPRKHLCHGQPEWLPAARM
jgi:hypothetical protein